MQKNVNYESLETELDRCMAEEKGDTALKKMLHILGDPFSYSELWKHRDFFVLMQDENRKETLAYYAIMAVLKMLVFDLPEARAFQRKLPAKSFAAYYLWAVIPETAEQWETGMEAVLGEFPDEIQAYHITMGRPTLYNGIWCLANFGKDFLQRESLKEFFVRCCGKRGQGMYQILLAETHYQNNECFDALTLEVGNIHWFERTGNKASLFVALYIQMCVMMVTGQLQAVRYVMEQISRRVQGTVSAEVIKNVEALAAWCALYDRNYPLIQKWMDEKAPNEYGELCLLDLFPYLVKLRIYLMWKKHYALLGLAEHLLPLLQISGRRMDYCEVSIILALSYYMQGRLQEAFGLLDDILPIVKEYQFCRLVADEGDIMYRLLTEYKKGKRFEDTEFVQKLISMSQKMGILFPGYMNREPQKMAVLTEKETDVLRQIALDRTNGEIAEYFHISLNTVKYYTKRIYGKLEVKNRQKAVKTARELGIL